MENIKMTQGMEKANFLHQINIIGILYYANGNNFEGEWNDGNMCAKGKWYT